MLAESLLVMFQPGAPITYPMAESKTADWGKRVQPELSMTLSTRNCASGTEARLIKPDERLNYFFNTITLKRSFSAAIDQAEPVIFSHTFS